MNIMIHDLMHRYEKNFPEYKNGVFEMREKHYKMICKYSQNIIVDSQVGKKHVLESYKCSPNKIHILPFTVPSYLFKKSKKKNNIKLPKKYLFYPAQFWQHKNHINLISAFKMICNEIDDLYLVLCGAKKLFLNQIKKKIKFEQLEEKVIILGRVDDDVIRNLYKNSLSTVFVSTLGPTNIPPLEAISLKSPLICSNVYGMKEQIKNAAIFINPYNPKDIYKAIKKIYKNKDLRKKLILNGIKLYKTKNQKKFNQNFKLILDKIISKNFSK